MYSCDNDIEVVAMVCRKQSSYFEGDVGHLITGGNRYAMEIQHRVKFVLLNLLLRKTKNFIS